MAKGGLFGQITTGTRVTGRSFVSDRDPDLLGAQVTSQVSKIVVKKRLKLDLAGRVQRRRVCIPEQFDDLLGRERGFDPVVGELEAGFVFVYHPEKDFVAVGGPAGPQAGDFTVDGVGQSQAGDFHLSLIQIGEVFAASGVRGLGTQKVFQGHGEVVFKPGWRNGVQAFGLDGFSDKLSTEVALDPSQGGFFRGWWR